MADELEERIRERAFAIWEAQGHPEGLHAAHWEQARSELESTPPDADLANPLASGAAEQALKKPRRKKV